MADRSNYERVTTLIWVAVGILLIASFAFGWVLSSSRKAIILCAWTMGVPLYFMLDYICFHPVRKTGDELEFEKFKHAQDLGLRFWLAVLGVLALLYFDEKKIFQ